MPHKDRPSATSHLLSEPVTIRDARTVTGAGLGKTIGVPTININLSDVPPSLDHGIYACVVFIDSQKYKGALHFGPRPAVQRDVAMEVHLIDAVLRHLPSTVSVTIIGRIRDVRDFPSLDALRKAIADDVKTARGMLSA
ncbi:MAG: riboflavin kinase [Candidatus Peribacteraceae bacterium]|nr:riboflavin kinase [Candidatus Peribacteraceae bacterium]